MRVLIAFTLRWNERSPWKSGTTTLNARWAASLGQCTPCRTPAPTRQLLLPRAYYYCCSGQCQCSTPDRCESDIRFRVSGAVSTALSLQRWPQSGRPDGQLVQPGPSPQRQQRQQTSPGPPHVTVVVVDGVALLAVLRARVRRHGPGPRHLEPGVPGGRAGFPLEGARRVVA